MRQYAILPVKSVSLFRETD
jgi:hypothetical protein